MGCSERLEERRRLRKRIRNATTRPINNIKPPVTAPPTTGLTGDFVCGVDSPLVAFSMELADGEVPLIDDEDCP